MSVELPRDLLAAVAVSVSTEETRYYLNGVFIDPEGWLVATNGHNLAAARLADDVRAGLGSDELSEIIIPRDAVAGALKAVGKYAKTVTLERVGDRFALGGVMFTPINGSFPDWRRVVPGKDPRDSRIPFGAPLVPVTFGWEVLKAIYDTGKVVGQKIPRIHWRPDASEPVAVTYPAAPALFFVAMPLRDQAVAGDAWPGVEAFKARADA